MYKVGFTWNSYNGPRTIAQLGDHPRTGLPTYAVTTGDSHIAQLIPVSEIEKEIQRDERSFEMRQIAVAKAAEEALVNSRHDNWYGFIDTFRSPTAKAKALAALNKQVSINSTIGERGALIKQLVDHGYTIQQSSGGTMWSGKKLEAGRVLAAPNGSYFIEKDLTKTGLDFAEYLLSIK